MTVRLERLAIVHSGDKGNTCNIGIVPYSAEAGAWLIEHLTVVRFQEVFSGLVAGQITRYELPGTGCLNFVLEQALDGGVTRSLCLDGHGKSWSYLAGTIELNPPEEVVASVAKATSADFVGHTDA